MFKTGDSGSKLIYDKINELSQDRFIAVYVRSSMTTWPLALCPNSKDLSCVLYGRWFSVVQLPLRPASLKKYKNLKKFSKTQNNSWHAFRRTQRSIDRFARSIWRFLVEYPVSV